MQRTTSIGAACVLALLAIAPGCAQGNSPELNGTAPGTLLQNPASADGFTYFLADSNFNGGASALHIEKVVWGRLVDLFAKDPGTGVSMKIMRDLLVNPNIDSDGTVYQLELNPVTLHEELTILYAFGSPEFDAAFEPLRNDVGLEEFIPKGVSANELPPFTAVPRNATIAIQFNDLLDPASINGSNVRVLAGYPPKAPFEARVVADRSHGGLVNGVMRSSRVLIDPTVSQVDAQNLGLKVNARGFPPATTKLLVNLGVRIPTAVSPTAAQFNILKNISGHGVAFTGNGPSDAGTPTKDVIRGFRAGGPSLVTGDPFNGYLADSNPPEVVGTQQVVVGSILGPIAPGQFEVTMNFASLACAVQPRPGDLLVVQNGVMRVLSPGAALAGATVTNLLIERIDESHDLDEPPAQGPAEFRTPWDPGLGFLPGCFVSFNPGAITPPTTGVPITSTVRLTFSEPMDSVRTNAFDGIKITDPTVPVASTLRRTVVARMAPNEELTSFVLEPSMPFKHTNGSATDTFEIDVISFKDQITDVTFGVTDLAGNVIAEPLPQVTFTVDAAAPSVTTGSVSLRFTSLDEDGNGSPEIRGQVVPDFSRGVMQSRAVVRFSTFADPTPMSAPSVQVMTAVGGVFEPLSIYGSRTMTCWRYEDLGMPFADEFYQNIDVEGLAWMVFGSGVSIDNFPEFEMSLGHSGPTPDATINPMTGQLVYPNSGLIGTFAQNVADSLVTVSSQSDGYLIQSLDSFKTPSDSLMTPYPLNRNKPQGDYTYWTWRDTSNLALGGQAAGGVGGYPAGSVPTIGLPLLMDFKTWPAPTQAQGFNQVFIATSNSVVFRAHSTGGILPDLSQQLIDPNQQATAIGGLTQAGAPTPGTDTGFYYGNADFVTRVSQMHTIWFDLGTASTFNNLVTIPTPTEVPDGLELLFAFRGAQNLTGLTAAANANNYDPYGNAIGGAFSVTFLNGDASWTSSLTDLAGARAIQIRVTMIADAETAATAEIDALGFSYAQ